MSCFPCFSKEDEESENDSSNGVPTAEVKDTHLLKKQDLAASDQKDVQATIFTFRDLATATRNFRPECLLGEGGFGRVYKGCLEKTKQVVAIKQLDRAAFQGNKEFLVEAMTLGSLHHENLVNLIGYCADGEQRLLVYEYMPSGSLESHLLDLPADKKPLSWHTRMMIAYGAAQGLEYLHDKANPPVIHRDIKSSNILLDENFNPKISGIGLTKSDPMGDLLHVSSPVMGTYGYSAPEYTRTGHVTIKSDVYSFGVVMLELITGRRALDTAKPMDEQNLVSWAMPLFRDQKRFPELIDPLIRDEYPEKALNQAVGIAAMCLQEESSVRPIMADVVMTLSFLTMEPVIPRAAPSPAPPVHTAEQGADADGHHEDAQQGANADGHHEDAHQGANSDGHHEDAQQGANARHHEEDADENREDAKRHHEDTDEDSEDSDSDEDREDADENRKFADGHHKYTDEDREDAYEILKFADGHHEDTDEDSEDSDEDRKDADENRKFEDGHHEDSDEDREDAYEHREDAYEHHKDTSEHHKDADGHREITYEHREITYEHREIAYEHHKDAYEHHKDAAEHHKDAAGHRDDDEEDDDSESGSDSSSDRGEE